MHTAYLSVYTDSAGDRVWAAMFQGLPLCPDGPEERARAVYDRLRLGRVTTREYPKRLPETPAVWDGDRGQFV
jgi:hypothetical protein